MAAKPGKRWRHESALIGNLIYLFGGKDYEKYFPRSEIHVFDIRRQTWDLQIAGGSDIPPPCRDARCVVIDGLIYSYGGWAESKSLSDVYCLDPKEMKWELVDISSQGLKPEGRLDHCLCAVGSRVIMFSGVTNEDDDKVYELKLDGRKKGMWVEVKTRGREPEQRQGAAMVAVDDHRAFVHGGFGSDCQYLDSCFVLDLEKKEWTAIAFDQQPSGRTNHSLCRLEGTNRILLIGGQGNEGMSDHGYILDLETKKAYKMERAEPNLDHTAHCVQKSDKTIGVILLGGKDLSTHRLKSIVTDLRIALISHDYARMDLTTASVQPSSVVCADLEGSEDQIILQLQEEKADLRRQCVRHEARVSHLEKEVSWLRSEEHTLRLRRQLNENKQKINKMTRQRSRFEQRVAEKTDELLRNEHMREELANECGALEASLAESQRSIDKFLSVITVKQEKIELTDQKLGSGAFADVCIGRLHGMPVAVKKFHQLITTPMTSPLFRREVLISSRLHHPNIVTVCGVVMEEGVPLQVVAELLQGSASELMNAAHASGCYLTGYEQLSIAMETTSAMAYLHQISPQPYVHSDIRPTNLLVARDMTVKLGDLGTAHLLESLKSAGPLSSQYLAPERMPRADESASQSSLESDVYSLGVTMIEIFTGVAAILEERDIQLRSMTDRRQLCQFCSRMIAVRASDRPSAQTCLSAFAAEKELIRPRFKRLVKGKFKAGVHAVKLSENHFSC